MMRHCAKRVVACLVVLSGAMLPGLTTLADKTDRIIEGEQANTKSAVQSQDRVNTIADKTQQLFQDYQLELKRIEDLTSYNTQLTQQIRRQQQSMLETEKSIDDVAIIERQVTPLMERMVKSLETFIKLDVPFLLEERYERIAFLKHTLARADVTIAEKFRQVMEAYNVEMDYGNTIESYRGTLKIGENAREVEFLRVGRIGLLYQSLDGSDIGAWNNETRDWQELGGRYARDIRLGLKVAKKQAAPELLTLPMPAPEPAS
ncbi:MAG: hypothetical protein CMK83_09435 [Pseudomonadales bacterium]|jgi:hypothetical protein|uniref:DUF3450 domain-containing protein n=1 Tax=unclassified Ketobacter TaxID=2639109 RepID=UPI000C3A2D79|nr:MULTISPECIES: DUF3450 domain-containing protein [unclassified Ketobacter]MAQ24432.1 hypothetical protein [Pseudomonadales bacterium]MEC8812885.1 DUF3450 domain-containing protein [Pseudomonadota bacterium]TNC86555.1 MAG: hypothetical protein CSH49_16195 [Alcanivorax sp.]HAG92552.1 hypothetical protein [Gammaproteobacteria bacterium]MBI25336.1 hypothetical protein [Pseudomonadales bacterium]|tara:strand:+ start:231 stop:1013 length:783 start_codon:yes stop_codon:yes gene_type:complete